jgi:serine/threonine protein kinase/Tfp pilus assembly protein PilF
MDTGRWQRVEALFNEAVELPEGEREGFLRRECAGDEALYNEVRALLKADDAPHSMLDGRAIDAIDPPPRPATLPEGTRVGPYRIVGVIGAGGMGAVYLAERAEGAFEQKVALKLIKRGMDSEIILARFHAERRILARLQHPNIGTLLDGGMTEDGLPYFTMEYVDGHPINEYCDENRLSIEERLDLFQSVCAAVQYAHGNLVVHRDLKPSNILVTRDGHVKLLDFGIARVLDEDEDGLTRSGQRVMTPAYASPEQIRGEPVTVATDVYSLGVVLYELLCGRHPHRDTTSTPAELERAIADTPAERPSRFITKIGTVGSTSSEASLETVARARRLAPARLHKRLAGDLDNICLMALRKEPERRYASASQLQEDIQRHLSGRPVGARPDTARYRFGKFVRRNRAGVAIAALLIVTVATLTTLYTSRLARERDRARLEAARAAEVSKFLTSLFEAADPYTSRGETITARELLDEGNKRVHGELSDQPEVLATMLGTIGQAYTSLGALEEAHAALEESAALQRRIYGDRSEQLSLALSALASNENELGHYEEAEKKEREAVSIARGLPNRRPFALAVGMLALTVNYQGRFAEADSLYRQSIEAWEGVEGPDSPEGSIVMNNFALMLHESSRYAEAETWFERALDIQERVFGKRHPETSTTRYNYAQLNSDRGHLDEARALWDEVLATDRALYPDGHPNIAFTLSAYGRLLMRLGDFGRSEELQREALEIRRKYLGDTHAEVGYSLVSLARIVLERGRYDEAERYYDDAMEILRQAVGTEHPVLGNIMNDKGLLMYERGDYAQANRILKESFDFQREVTGGVERNAMSVSMVRRAQVLAALGRMTEADSLAESGVELSRRLHEDNSMWLAGGTITLAEIRRQEGAVEEAESLFTDSLNRMRSFEASAEARPRDTGALIGLGRCRLARGDTAGAESRCREALAIEQRFREPGDPEIARAQIALAEALMASGPTAEADALLREAIGALTPVVRPGQIDLVEAKELLRQNL